jgi:hypothetical protein
MAHSPKPTTRELLDAIVRALREAEGRRRLATMDAVRLEWAKAGMGGRPKPQA